MCYAWFVSTVKILDKKTLENLYITKRLDSYAIAKILKCSPSHIRDNLREFSIKTRSVQEAKSLMKPRYKRTNFNGSANEKSYLIGFRLGDLHISKTHPNSPTIRASCNTTKKDQLDLISKLFSGYGYVSKYPRDKNGAIAIRCFINNSFDFLLKKEDKIDEWILRNKSCFMSFLAGYADAEATFCICGGDGVFSLKTQDKNILWQIYERLNRLGILCKAPGMFRPAGYVDKRGIKNNKDAWILTIYRKDSLLKLIKFLDPELKHKKRRLDMEKVKKNIIRRNILYNNMPDRRWLQTYKP